MQRADARQEPDAAERLLRLLEPIHQRAQATARRLSRCAADGDDLFQEAVLRALERLAELREEASFGAWFYAVLLSVHRARGRRDFWRRFLPLSFGSAAAAADSRERPGSPAATGTTLDEEHAGAARMAQALAALPGVQREAIVLFTLDGFSLEEVAALQGASVTAVKTRLLRGRARLRKQYETLLIDEEREALCPTKEVRSV